MRLPDRIDRVIVSTLTAGTAVAAGAVAGLLLAGALVLLCTSVLDGTTFDIALCALLAAAAVWVVLEFARLLPSWRYVIAFEVATGLVSLAWWFHQTY